MGENMYYSDEIVEEVRSQNDIVDVISSYVRLQKKGSSYFGLCPFHNEKSPSFSVSRQKQMYYCFGCGAGGNVFTFIMNYENFTFVEALAMLADRAGITLPQVEYSKEKKEQEQLKTVVLEMNKLTASYFYAQLKGSGGATAYKYLVDRELSKETMLNFGLGYSNKYSNDLCQYLKSKGYSDEMLAKSGLVNFDERQGMYDRFWNRVMFPIMDANSRVIGFGGRVMGDGKPKYLNSPETVVFDKSRNLYGLNRARTSRKSYFLICEGYMDVIALHQAGFTNAVATLGTALTSGQASLIKRYVQEVYLTYDSDEAGTKAALRAMPILKAAGVSAKVLRMDPYKDPDEFIKAEGAEAFEARIAQSRNGFLYSIEVLQRSYDMTSPEGKTDFYNAAAQRLLEFEEELERTNYIEAVAKEYRISTESLTKLVGQMAIKKGLVTPVKKPEPTMSKGKKKEDGTLTSQKILLTWITSGEQICRIVKKHIQPEDFTLPIYRQVATFLYQQYEEGAMNPAKIISYFTDDEEHREVASLFHTKIKELTTKEEQEKALKETIIKVKKASLEHATTELDPMDIVGLQRVMEGKRELERLEKLHISLN